MKNVKKILLSVRYMGESATTTFAGMPYSSNNLAKVASNMLKNIVLSKLDIEEEHALLNAVNYTIDNHEDKFQRVMFSWLYTEKDGGGYEVRNTLGDDVSIETEFALGAMAKESKHNFAPVEISLLNVYEFDAVEAHRVA